MGDQDLRSGGSDDIHRHVTISRPHPPIQFHWHMLSGHTAALIIMRENQTFLGSTRPCDFKCRILFVSMFNDVECRIKDHQQTCLANATEFTEYAKQFELGHSCFCGPRQTERSMGSHCQKKRADICRSVTSNIFIVLSFARKEISNPRRAIIPFLFKVRPQKKTVMIRTHVGMQSVVHLRCSM